MDGAINIFRNVLARTFSLKGRMNRTQYWTFILLHLVLMLVFIWFSDKLAISLIWQIYALLMLLPYISATVKRLHDINKKGWWMLCWFIPVFGWVYLFVLLIELPKPEHNVYGNPEDWSIIEK